MNIQGTPTSGIRWLIDANGRIVGYRNPVSDQDSASSDVVPRTSATPGTAILPATLGAWVILKSDGTNWQAVAGA